MKVDALIAVISAFAKSKASAGDDRSAQGLHELADALQSQKGKTVTAMLKSFPQSDASVVNRKRTR